MINFFKNLPYKYLFYLGIPVVLIFLSLGYWQFTSYLEVQDRNRLDTHSELPKKTLISEYLLEISMNLFKFSKT